VVLLLLLVVMVLALLLLVMVLVLVWVMVMAAAVWVCWRLVPHWRLMPSAASKYPRSRRRRPLLLQHLIEMEMQRRLIWARLAQLC
jgi:fatty acid desaturase